MNRFRPAVEALDARTLPSAVFATFTDPTASTGAPAQVTAESHEATIEGGGEADGSLAATGKVKLSDFHFTAKMSKSSPKLF